MSDACLTSKNWSSKSLEQITSKITDGAHFSPVPQEYGYLIANVKDMLENQIDFESCTNITYRAFNELKKQNCSPRTGDILLSKDGTIGKVILYKGEREIVVLSSIAIIRLDTSVSSDFVKHVLRSFIFDKQLYALQSGSALKRIVLADIRKLFIPFPNRHVQEKIAKILTTIDQLIEKTETLIDKQSAIKKGMMADLFTRGIDLTTGQLRPSIEQAPHLYKETELGWVPTEWSVENFQNRVEISYGKSQVNVRDKQGCIPVYGTGGIIEYAGKPLFNEDSILIGRKGTLNKPFFVKAPFWVVDTAYYVSSYTDSDIHFLSYFFLKIDFEALNESTGVPSLNRETLYRVKLAFPGVEEQLEITTRLESVDDAIKENQVYLKKITMNKKGLMQDLLTGKVPV